MQVFFFEISASFVSVTIFSDVACGKRPRRDLDATRRGASQLGGIDNTRWGREGVGKQRQFAISTN